MNLAPRNDWNGEERIPEPSSFKSTGFFRATYGSVFQEEREPRHLWDSAETDPLLPEHWEWEKAGLSGHVAYRRRISYTLGNNSAYAAPLPSKKKKKAFGRENARRNLNNTPQLACALWRARMFSRLSRRRASIIASEKLCQGGQRSQAGKKRIHLSIRPCRGFSLFTSRCAAVQRRSRRPAKSPCPPEATGTVMGMTARRA